MVAKQECVVVVEAVSAGRFYAREARARGFLPAVVFPRLEAGRNYIEARKKAEEYCLKHGALIINEPDDYIALLKQLGEYKVRAVAAGGELGVPLADRLAESLRLPGNPACSSIVRRDKELMQRALAVRGLRHIRGRRAASVKEAVEAARQLDAWPLVLKPLAGAATVGVHFCRDAGEVRACAAELFSSTDVFGLPNSEILVQECIRGREFVLNFVSRNGAHQLTDMWMCKKVPLGLGGNPYEHIRLITSLEAGHAGIINYAYQVLSALDFKYGPAQMEVMVDGGGPVLIEVGARPMDGGYPPDILKEALGHCVVDRALESYLRPEESAGDFMRPYRPAKSLMIKYLFSPAGMKLHSTPALPLMRRLASVRRVDFGGASEQEGLEGCVDLFTAPGYVLLCHERSDVLMRDYRFIRWMESSYFTMLLDDEKSFVPETDLEKMRADLERMMEKRECAGNCLVVVDADASRPEAGAGARLCSLAGAGDLEPEARFDNIFLHCGHRVLSFAEYCAVLEKLVERLNPGGSLFVTPRGIRATPYGPTGMEALLLLMGLRLEVPPHFFQGVLWATKK